MTASIARMNLVLHGVEDSKIARGDTLAAPAFHAADRLETFDVVLANPPYSIKQWNREAWTSDPWGRNFLGTPPQGRADYAFFQHILKSMNPKTGRCAVLFPHGVLFRRDELEMRQELIDSDLLEAVIGLGPNLFYNSAMESCIVVSRSGKPSNRRGKIIFIDASDDVSRDRAMSFLGVEHLARIGTTYTKFLPEEGYAKVATVEEIAKQGYSLSIPLYVKRLSAPATHRPSGGPPSWQESWELWNSAGRSHWATMHALVNLFADQVADGQEEQAIDG